MINRNNTSNSSTSNSSTSNNSTSNSSTSNSSNKISLNSNMSNKMPNKTLMGIKDNKDRRNLTPNMKITSKNTIKSNSKSKTISSLPLDKNRSKTTSSLLQDKNIHRILINNNTNSNSLSKIREIRCSLPPTPKSNKIISKTFNLRGKTANTGTCRKGTMTFSDITMKTPCLRKIAS